MRDPLLVEHGTQAFRLKPTAVVHAAKTDIRNRDRNGRGAERGKYLFAWSHVRGATDARDLIRQAIASPATGNGSRNLNTREVYRDTDLLRAALATLEGEG